MAKSTPPKKPAVKTAATATATAAKATPATAKPRPTPARAKAPLVKASAAVPKAKPAQSSMNGLADKVAIKAPVKPAAAAKPTAPAKEKIKKAKLVRDSFTMPEAEYAVLGAVKKACLKAGFEVKKSQLLRVGVALIQNIDIAKLKSVLATLPPLQAGRPKKEK